MRNTILLAGTILLLSTAPAHSANKTPSLIQWQSWSEDLFTAAAQQNKLIVLDLEAVWCHWCHVMDEKTYHHPEVVRLIEQRYVPVRVDQDSHPELSRRYEDFGWPATIFFRPDGSEIIRLRGYIPPQRMIKLLAFIADNPDEIKLPPEVVVVPRDQAGLSADQRKHIDERLDFVYDREHGGWGQIHRFIHTHSMEYLLTRAWQGSGDHAAQAKQTLGAARHLLDPVWGGVYQYSDQLDWKSPHYEKIMSFQTDYIRMYAFAYMLFGDAAYLQVAESIHGYLTNFLKDPAGVFYTSQDADLNQEIDGRDFYSRDDRSRRALGMPRIDRNIYARENGWVISALTTLYAATGEQSYLDQADTAARWVIANRSVAGGGFHHGQDVTGVYLDDSLAMGRAFLDLHTVSGERHWLQRAIDSGGFIATHFLDRDGGGFATSPLDTTRDSVLSKPLKHLDSNIEMVRLAVLLHRYTALDEVRGWAEHGMKYLSAPAIVEQRRLLAGLLLADREWRDEPVHMAVVGAKDDPLAQTLVRAAIRYPGYYKRVEWWDHREGPLPNPDVRYPELERAAAFACANRTCSLPVFEPDQVAAAVDRLYSRSTAAAAD